MKCNQILTMTVFLYREQNNRVPLQYFKSWILSNTPKFSMEYCKTPSLPFSYPTFILPIVSPTSSYFCQLSCPPSFIYQLNVFLATAFPPPVHHPCNLSTISKLLRLLLGIPTCHATVFILPRVLIFLAPPPFDLPLAGRARNVACYIRNVHRSGEFPRPAAIARNDPYGFSLA